MNKYKELDLAIQCIAQTKEEYHRFKKMAIDHFEGKYNFEEMPSVLQLAIAEWENNNID